MHWTEDSDTPIHCAFIEIRGLGMGSLLAPERVLDPFDRRSLLCFPLCQIEQLVVLAFVTCKF
jgi:hypothetical protein